MKLRYKNKVFRPFLICNNHISIMLECGSKHAFMVLPFIQINTVKSTDAKANLCIAIGWLNIFAGVCIIIREYKLKSGKENEMKLTEKKKEKPCWSVFVGGGEVNDYLLTKTEADELAFEFEMEGYDDVKIVRIKAK